MHADAMPLTGSAEAEAQRIAKGLRSKDLAVMNELIDWYQYRLARYLFYVTGKRENVEDLAQETWVRVMERGSQYDGRSRFESWLFSIARNLAFDQFRKRRALSLDSHNDSDSSDGAFSRDIVEANQPSPFLAAARSEDAARLAAAMESLEPIYREALLLRFQEELSLQEIARITGAPVTTISSRIYRGLAALRSGWQGGTNAI
jgi:RNA polymerase sigma-70 factor, ECF subfamily